MQGESSSTYNLLTVVFVSLAVFVCACALLMMAGVVRPPEAFRPRTPTFPPTLVLPSVTPTETPTITPTPSETPIPTATLTETPTATPVEATVTAPGFNPAADTQTPPPTPDVGTPLPTPTQGVQG